MKVVRTIARPMIAGVFVVPGLDVLANPEPRAKVTKPVVDMGASVVPFAPSDPVDAVRLNAAVQLGARRTPPSLAACWWWRSIEVGRMEHTGAAGGC